MSMTGSSQTLSTFEFTKRKRWAEILVTGLTDVIVFILSHDGKVLYCGNAVGELLGWSETDFIDLHLNDYIHVEDKVKFQLDFEHAVRTHTELITYVRFKCNTLRPSHSQSSDILFEVKGYPHFVTKEDQDPECKCFFAMAKPYPSRSIDMLNTFLEQKMENEKLQQRLATLKARVNSQVTPADQTLPSVDTIYATSSLQHTRYSNPHEDPSKTSSGVGYDDRLFGGDYSGDKSQIQAVPEEPEDGSRKKKLKKTHGTEQYVCRKCGRTDSPEWRKGPDGPKTLCNACGLRWAKQMRRSDDPTDEVASYNQPLSSSAEA